MCPKRLRSILSQVAVGDKNSLHINDSVSDFRFTTEKNNKSSWTKKCWWFILGSIFFLSYFYFFLNFCLLHSVQRQYKIAIHALMVAMISDLSSFLNTQQCLKTGLS